MKSYDPKKIEKITLNKNSRAAVFIDASNIYHSQKHLGFKIDFKKLLDYLKKETNLSRVYFYTAYDPEHEKQKSFLDFLEIIGYKVRTKKVKFIKDKNNESGGFHKGNLDVELTIDVLENKDNYETLILVSGDSDFAPLLQLMKMKYGKKCFVMATKYNVSIELIKCAKYINFSKFKKFIKK
ncbi:MAG: NYN domain-containing protein [Candidatus Pacebacteria bacterium]|nr:NYN domain-containing protein [Candidatus Paceibacterota bacterium]NUQ57545.1 NYN domain-containing protein [Candidatus Paceibacter sp.]